MLDDVGLAGVARQVIGCRLTQETRVQSALDHVASIIRQALGVTGCYLTQETRAQSALNDVARIIRQALGHGGGR